MAPLLELEHVFNAQQGFLRPLLEGRLAVGNIVNIGVKSRVGNEVKIEATVVRSTNISKEPVTVNITIIHQEAVVEKRIKEISCSCPAGACKSHCCKHAMAVIIYLERKDESELEVLTCTDIRQMWDKVKGSTMSKFDPAPLSEFCHFPKTTSVYRRPINDVTEEMELEFLNQYLLDLPQSEAAIFRSEVREPKTVRAVPSMQTRPNQRIIDFYNNAVSNPHFLVNKIVQLSQELLLQCSSDEQDFYRNNIVVSADEALQIFLGSLGQDNAIWDGARFGRITGSISYELFTYFVNKNPDWEPKLDGIFGNDFKNDAMIAGNIYESYALKKYILEECKRNYFIDSMEVGIFINPSLPWLGFSADAVIFKDGVASKLWENKTPVAGRTINSSGICSYLPYMDKEGKLKHKCFTTLKHK